MDPNDDFDVPPEYSALCVVPSAKASTWPPQLIFDLALGLDDYQTLEDRYNISRPQLDKLFSRPVFRKELALMTRELREKNTIFKNKAKVQAEAYLDETLPALMADPNTPAGTKLSVFQTLAKYGGLEPKEAPVGADPAGMRVSRMVVEWVGGEQDFSPVAQKTIELAHND